MNWPTHTDYQDAIQSPSHCFSEEDLKLGTVTNDMLGMPRVMSGNFASVYEVTTQQGKRHAIRCFVRQVANQQVRYNLLTRHLQAVSLPYLVGFEFQLRGIRVRNEWYPIVRMDWVTCVPMHIYVEDHVNEPETMLRLSERVILAEGGERAVVRGQPGYRIKMQAPRLLQPLTEPAKP